MELFFISDSSILFFYRVENVCLPFMKCLRLVRFFIFKKTLFRLVEQLKTENATPKTENYEKMYFSVIAPTRKLGPSYTAVKPPPHPF